VVGEEEFDFVVRNLISNNAQKLHSAKNASKRNPIRKKKEMKKFLFFVTISRYSVYKQTIQNHKFYQFQRFIACLPH
jgi:hypothetical protein